MRLPALSFLKKCFEPRLIWDDFDRYGLDSFKNQNGAVRVDQYGLQVYNR